MNSSENVSCVNCGCSSRTKFSLILKESSVTIALYTEWLSPYILNENDLTCKHCLEHAHFKIGQIMKTDGIDDETQPTLTSSVLAQIENRKVCVMCAKSVSRRRSCSVLCDDGSEKKKLASSLICQATLTPHKKINADSMVCQNCLIRIGRCVKQMQTKSHPPQDLESENNDTQGLESQNNDTQGLESQNNDTQDLESQNNDTQDLESQNDDAQNDTLEEESIDLPSYRRSPDTSDQCLFEDCQNEDLHSISDELRAKLIKNYHYLVTAQARICQHHLDKNNWKTLFNAKNSISNFKPDHVEHVLSFVVTSKCTDIDFNHIIDYDDSVVEYFLGVSKESFSVILKMLPELKGVENGVLGLMGLLMRHWIGGPVTKAAGLLKLCPKTLESAMADVKKILKYSPVTIDMGIEYLIKK